MSQVEHAISARPARGELVSGDVAVMRMIDGHAVAGVADVLGHGPSAHRVAQVIEAFLRDHAQPDIVDTLLRLDELLQGTIGAAVALCAFELSSGRVSYIGVGNVTARCLTPNGSSNHEFVSRDGIVGAACTRRRIHARACSARTLEHESVMLLYTDGIRSALRTSDHPSLASSDMATVARVVVEQFARDHDDATCMALRYCR